VNPDIQIPLKPAQYPQRSHGLHFGKFHAFPAKDRWNWLPFVRWQVLSLFWWLPLWNATHLHPCTPTWPALQQMDSVQGAAPVAIYHSEDDDLCRPTIRRAPARLLPATFVCTNRVNLLICRGLHIYVPI
jgi:hypothetical protein